jgi:hypothetical protein
VTTPAADLRQAAACILVAAAFWVWLSPWAASPMLALAAVNVVVPALLRRKLARKKGTTP